MDLGWDLKEVRSHNLPLNPLLNKGNWNQKRKKLEKNKKLSRVLQDIGGSASHGNQRHWVARKPLRCLRRQFKRVYLVTIDPKESNSQRFLGSEAQSASNRLKVSSHKSTLTLITPWNREHNSQPIVNLNKSPIPYNHIPTILGVN